MPSPPRVGDGASHADDVATVDRDGLAGEPSGLLQFWITYTDSGTASTDRGVADHVPGREAGPLVGVDAELLEDLLVVLPQ